MPEENEFKGRILQLGGSGSGVGYAEYERIKDSSNFILPIYLFCENKVVI